MPLLRNISLFLLNSPFFLFFSSNLNPGRLLLYSDAFGNCRASSAISKLHAKISTNLLTSWFCLCVCLFPYVFMCVLLFLSVLVKLFTSASGIVSYTFNSTVCVQSVRVSASVVYVVTSQLLLSLPSTPLDHAHGCPSFYGDSPQLQHGKTTSPV